MIAFFSFLALVVSRLKNSLETHFDVSRPAEDVRGVLGVPLFLECLRFYGDDQHRWPLRDCVSEGRAWEELRTMV